ncbi:MAG: SUMF1/EgtB/PvdO family nonheme iron enzyme [Anaerolineales bacterium]|nr:SUMF1/EgtB/PvdO family nonheme iron enzyme [Anaerolineales bacterium]
MPQHDATLDAFQIGKYLVAISSTRRSSTTAVTPSNGMRVGPLPAGRGSKITYPAAHGGVLDPSQSRSSAQLGTKPLHSTQLGLGTKNWDPRCCCRSEAQWEKAARNGWAALSVGARDHVGACKLCRDQHQASRCRRFCSHKGKVPLGLQDAAGNVWEWTTTKWVDNYENYQPDDQLEGDARRTLRGGAQFSDDRGVRCAWRLHDSPELSHRLLGFRLLSTDN